MNKDKFQKEVKSVVNHLMDRRLYANMGLEKAWGTRDLWLKNGLKTGVLLGAAIFSPKHKALFALWCLYSLADNVMAALDLDREEMKWNERMAKSGQNIFDILSKGVPPVEQAYDPKKNGPIN